MKFMYIRLSVRMFHLRIFILCAILHPVTRLILYRFMRSSTRDAYAVYVQKTPRYVSAPRRLERVRGNAEGGDT